MLGEITSKLEDLIEVTLLLPLMREEPAETAAQLSDLRKEVAALRAQYESLTERGTAVEVHAEQGAASQEPSPLRTNAKALGYRANLADFGPRQNQANPTANQEDNSANSGPKTDPQKQTNGEAALKSTGQLTGRALDYENNQPIPKAVAIARCGDQGQYDYVTRTDSFGRYFFPEIQSGTCLVRAAKWLSPEEVSEAAIEFTKLLKAENNDKNNDKNADYSCDKVKGSRALFSFMSETGQLKEACKSRGLKPKYRAYQERTIKNLEITSNQTTVANDLLLPRRTTSLGEFARAISGFQQSGANSADSVQRFFFDMWLSTPPPFTHGQSWAQDPNFGVPMRFWGDVRVTSVPQQIQSSLGEFAVGFATQVGSLKVNQVAQAVEFLGGSEVRLWHWGVSQSRLLSFDQSARERFGLYWTAGGGFSTPINPATFTQTFLNPTPGSNPIFDSQISALGLTNEIAGKKYIAFTSLDRTKFLREYYGGFRVKSYYYDRDTDEPLRRFPATLDVLVGQNESITGGIFHHPVLRVEGFYPLPYEATKFIYLFGTGDLVFGSKRSTNPILLQPAPNAPSVPDPSIFLIPQLQSKLTRDQYRIGVGIDAIQLIDSIKNMNKNKPSDGRSNAATPAPATAPPPTKNNDAESSTTAAKQH